MVCSPHMPLFTGIAGYGQSTSIDQTVGYNLDSSMDYASNQNIDYSTNSNNDFVVYNFDENSENLYDSSVSESLNQIYSLDNLIDVYNQNKNNALEDKALQNEYFVSDNIADFVTMYGQTQHIDEKQAEYNALPQIDDLVNMYDFAKSVTNVVSYELIPLENKEGTFELGPININLPSEKEMLEEAIRRESEIKMSKNELADMIKREQKEMVLH